jgi:hypothetical protein
VRASLRASGPLSLPDSTGSERSAFRAFSLLTARSWLYNVEVSLASNPRSGTSLKPARVAGFVVLGPLKVRLVGGS